MYVFIVDNMCFAHQPQTSNTVNGTRSAGGMLPVLRSSNGPPTTINQLSSSATSTGCNHHHEQQMFYPQHHHYQAQQSLKGLSSLDQAGYYQQQHAQLSHLQNHCSLHPNYNNELCQKQQQQIKPTRPIVCGDYPTGVSALSSSTHPHHNLPHSKSLDHYNAANMEHQNVINHHRHSLDHTSYDSKNPFHHPAMASFKDATGGHGYEQIMNGGGGGGNNLPDGNSGYSHIQHPYNVSGTRYPLPYSISSQLNNGLPVVPKRPHWLNGRAMSGGGAVEPCYNDPQLTILEKRCDNYDAQKMGFRLPPVTTASVQINGGGVGGGGASGVDGINSYTDRPSNEYKCPYNLNNGSSSSANNIDHHYQYGVTGVSGSGVVRKTNGSNSFMKAGLAADSAQYYSQLRPDLGSSDELDGRPNVTSRPPKMVDRQHQTPRTSDFDSYEELFADQPQQQQQQYHHSQHQIKSALKTNPSRTNSTSNKIQDGVGSFETWDYVYQSLDQHERKPPAEAKLKPVNEYVNNVIAEGKQSRQATTTTPTTKLIDKSRTLSRQEASKMQEQISTLRAMKPDGDGGADRRRTSGTVGHGETSSMVVGSQQQQRQSSSDSVAAVAKTRSLAQSAGSSSLKRATTINSAERTSKPKTCDRTSATEPPATSSSQWSCRFCTFLNPNALRICEMCSKSKDFNIKADSGTAPTCV